MPTDPPPEWVLLLRHRVGGRIRAARLSRGWSQERLSEVAGVDRKTIYRTENANHSTSIDHLAQMAHALGVPLAQLVRD